MSVHPVDSRIFGAAWGRDELRPFFEDEGRTRGWCEVLAVLAEEEGALAIIPADAAAEIARVMRDDLPDLDEVRRGAVETGHSLLGLIRAQARRCAGGAGEWICYGCTVQDVTDTWYAHSLLAVADLAERDLDLLEADLVRLARAHRSTPMLGRTHGQAGLPITFGYKVAVWIDELRRHRQRLVELRPRLGVGQLAGGVGTLSGYGPHGLDLQERVLARFGLAAPAISWTSARDRFAEPVIWLALVTATLDKIGQEVYNLQRSEIGELAEPAGPGGVGSITMPQKRNPERSEHLGTLARLVRRDADLLLEGMVGDHERDGRSWKTEWAAIPEACTAAGAALLIARELVAGLEVRPEAMRRNLDAWHEQVAGEAVMIALATLTGKQTAHERVHAALARARASGRPLRDELGDDPGIGGVLAAGEIRRLLAHPSTGLAEALVDRVLGG
ncbi:MAG: adenylosuccinate lyase [Chloroflexi bacterium]|nr:adenylosuccinate lyase [Chloroflexota bacterium]